MGNTDNNKTKKCRRKIRIRLVDPNIPDSYVCEVFDSSLENEEENAENESLCDKAENSAKPKNYFDLLMSKNSKKNGTINAASENEDIRICSDEESISKSKKHSRQKSNGSLGQLINGTREEIKSESDSSEDENLLKVQRKCHLKSLDIKEESQCSIDLIKEKAPVEEINKEVFSIFDSPKADSSQKKKLGILNYFSKSDSTPTNKNIEKLEEITSVVNSLKSNHQRSNRLKSTNRQNTVKTSLTEKKIPLSGINKENVKLAPLFCKKSNKVIDSDRQKARLDFLFKGSPTIVKKTDTKTSDSVFNFPRVPHVQQRNDSVYWSRREICLPLPEVHYLEESEFSSEKKFSLQIKHSELSRHSVTSHSIKINKEFLCKTKCKYVQLNLDSVIDGLKEKRDRFLEMEKSKIANHKNDETGFEELNTLWTEKYKPKSSEILGNGHVVKKLKKWLQSWKTFDEELKVLAKSSRTSKARRDSNGESSDDCFDSGSESYGLKPPGNVCVVSGPNGCGKTALVHALASELEFGVLELNASSKRTGKKVLSDLQEATQSHKVHRVNLLQTGFLQKGMKKKKMKKKKKNRKSEELRILDQPNDCQISLILIEDADIVYEEHDEGFFSAIASLVQTSKRPLIFLTNDPNCHFLYNFKPEQSLLLEMELPNFYKSCAVLDVVSSLEGAAYNEELLESLLRQNNFDLRRSLLQLQFWFHSGNNPSAFQNQFDLGRLWWGLSKFLYSQDIKHARKPKTRKRKRGNDLFDSSDEETETATKKFKSDSKATTLFPASNPDAMTAKSNHFEESCFRVLDLVSVLDGFRLPGSREPVPGFDCKPKDSLSLSENMEEPSSVRRRLSEELSNEMVRLSSRIFKEGLKSGCDDRKLDFVSPCWEEIRWRNSQEKAMQELCGVVTPLQRGRDKRSLHLDYLPVLRNICRVERNRSEVNPKRKNRFFHYLANLGLEITDEYLEINCDVFDRLPKT